MALDGKTYREITADWCVKTTALMLLLCIGSISITHWSTGSASTNGESGGIRLGLWRACASISDTRIFQQSLSVAGDCRYGHCIESFFFTPGARVDDHGLCSRAKVSAAFAIVSMGLCLLILYNILIKPITSNKRSDGFALFFSFVLIFTSLISWASWIAWMATFNGDTNRTDPNSINFSTLKPGACTVFMIIVFLLAIFNTVIQSRHYRDAVKEDLLKRVERRNRRAKYREGTREPLSPNEHHDGDGDDDDYDEDDDDDYEEESRTNRGSRSHTGDDSYASQRGHMNPNYAQSTSETSIPFDKSVDDATKAQQRKGTAAPRAPSRPPPAPVPIGMAMNDGYDETRA